MAENTAAEKPGHLKILEPNVATLWRRWKDEFHWYVGALGIQPDNNDRRLALLLNSAGPDARDVYDQFTYTEGESRDNVKDVIKKFDEFCGAKTNLVYERYIFITRMQEEGEGFDAFVVDVRKLASTCEFGALKESLIMMVVIIGLRDLKLQERLLKEDNLTLDRVVKLGRTNDIATRQMRVIHPAEQGAIAAVGMKPQSRNSSQTGSQNGSRLRREESQGAFDCRRCGTKHKPKNCPAFRFKCTNCDYRGHYTKNCNFKVRTVESREQQPETDIESGLNNMFVWTINMKKTQENVDNLVAAVGELQDDVDVEDKKPINRSQRRRQRFAVKAATSEEEESSVVPLVNNKGTPSPSDEGEFSVAEVEQRKAEIQHIKLDDSSRWTHPLVMNGDIVVVKLDTGAQANLLSEQDYRMLRIRPRLHKASVKLTDYSNNEIATNGSCILDVKVCGVNRKVRFVVVSRGPSLLGAQACERLGLVSRVFNITTGEIQHELEESRELKECTLPEVNNKLSSIPFTHEITLAENCTPVINAPRRVPVAIKDKLKSEIQRMVDLGVIEKVEAPTDWVNSIVVVGKPNGSIRVCLDPKDLNKAIKRERFQLPTREDIFSNMAGATWFSKLDASQAFWQVRLTEKSKDYTTFNTPFGRYRYCRLPYGLCSAPEVFHKVMEVMMEGLEGTRVYMDDILVWGHTAEEHDARLKMVKQRIDKYGLLMNWDKCCIKKREIVFIGEILSENGVSPNPERIAAVLNMKTPHNKEAVQRALGCINFVGKFVDNLAARCKHMRSLLCKNNQWCWNHEHEKEWIELKKTLSSKPVLSFFDQRLPTKISSDASKDGLGAVLLQCHGQDWRPVAYAARGMTACETRYAQIEKECLGITFGCKKFHQYVFGLPDLTLETDHKPLIPLSQKPLSEMTPRIQRLMLKLQQYSYKLEWTAGTNLYIADALSRANIHTVTFNVADEDIANDVSAHVNMVMDTLPASGSFKDRLVAATANDEVLQRVIVCVTNGWRKGQCMAYENFKCELSVVDGILLKGTRMVIPQELRGEMLDVVHVGHLGAEKQKRMARECIYWPNMNRDIDMRVQNCAACLKYRPAQSKETHLETECRRLSPWDRVGVDMFQWKGKQYLVCVDYYSNYPEIAMCTSTTSANVIGHLKSIFSRHGIPRIVVSDNGPQFSSGEFSAFSKNYGFIHQTSSPKYPQANGQAEKAVGIIKQLLSRASERGEDPYLAILAYRKAPREMGMSPAELLMGRRLRSQLPFVEVSNAVSREVVEARREKAQENKELYYNRGAKDLSRLRKDTVVRIHDKTWDRKAVVVEEVAPRSYVVEHEDGSRMRRNRRDLMATRERYIRDKEDDGEELRPAEDQTIHERVREDDKDQTLPVEKTVTLRRSSREIRKPKRLDL